MAFVGSHAVLKEMVELCCGCFQEILPWRNRRGLLSSKEGLPSLRTLCFLGWWCHRMMSYDGIIWWCHMMMMSCEVTWCHAMVMLYGDATWWMISWRHYMLMISLFVIGDRINLCMWGRCSTPLFYPFSSYLDTVPHTMPELTWNSHCSISSPWLGDLYTSLVPWLFGTSSIHNQAWLGLWPIYTAIKKLACFESY